MAKQLRSQATRAAIITGAAGVFNEHGFKRATLEAAAEAAGVTKGALYFHFPSKVELANAVIETQHEISRKYAMAAFARGSSALESLMWMSRGLAEQMCNEVVVSAGIRLSTESGSGELSRDAPYVDWMDAVETLLHEAVEQGDVATTQDPAKLARFIIPAYTGVQLVSDVVHQRTDLYKRVREMWEVLLPAIVVPERAHLASTLPELITQPARVARGTR